MLKVYRYRVKGSSSLRRLAKMAKAVNFTWNFCNDTQKSAIRHGKKWPTIYDFQPLVAGSSEELGLHSQTVQAVCRQYAQQRKQNRKRKLRYRGLRALGWVPFDGQAIRLSNDAFKFMGHKYRTWLSRPVPGRIRCGSFAQNSQGHWFINVCVDVDITQDCGQEQVGIDLGLKTTATFSDGNKYDWLRAFRAVEKKIAAAQRARKKSRVRTLHAKAKNRRRDGLHKLSTRLVHENKRVVVGDVSISKLVKTKMAKSVYDAGWGMFRDMLRYKTLARGATFIEVDEAYSSQRCSTCGTLPKSRPKGIAALEIREWVCSNCGQGHDRDINAARNILALGCERPAEEILVL